MLNLEKSRVVVMWTVWTVFFTCVAGIAVPALAKNYGLDEVTILLAIGFGILVTSFAGGGFFASAFRNEFAAIGLGVGLHQTVLVGCAAITLMPDGVGGGNFAVVIGSACGLAAYYLLIVSADYPLVYHGLTFAGMAGTIGGIAIGWPIAAFMIVCAVAGGAIAAWGAAKKPTPARARW